MDEEFEKRLEMVENVVKQGGIFFMTCDGIRSMKMEDFISQPADGILYDLNRDKATTVILAKDGTLGMRWVNDLAVAYVIKALKCELNKYKEKYDE